MIYVNPVSTEKVKYGLMSIADANDRILRIKNFAAKRKFQTVVKNSNIHYDLLKCTKYKLFFVFYQIYFAGLIALEKIMCISIPFIKLKRKFYQVKSVLS